MWFVWMKNAYVLYYHGQTYLILIGVDFQLHYNTKLRGE